MLPMEQSHEAEANEELPSSPLARAKAKLDAEWNYVAMKNLLAFHRYMTIYIKSHLTLKRYV